MWTEGPGVLVNVIGAAEQVPHPFVLEDASFESFLLACKRLIERVVEGDVGFALSLHRGLHVRHFLLNLRVERGFKNLFLHFSPPSLHQIDILPDPGQVRVLNFPAGINNGNAVLLQEISVNRAVVQEFAGFFIGWLGEGVEPGVDSLTGQGGKGGGFPGVEDGFVILITNILLNPDEVGILLLVDDIPETCLAGKWLLCYNARKR